MRFRNITRLALCCLVVLLVVASSAPLASACPTCKQALAQGGEAQQAIVSGYFYSILFMMSMPFVIIGTFGSMAWLAIRRGQAERGAANETPGGHDRQTPPATSDPHVDPR